jgi:hypothetical protein
VDATKLFAYIYDDGEPVPATVQYGSGVTSVTDTTVGDYRVFFNRSLVNCVVQAVAGHGDPTGAFQSSNAIPQVKMAGGAANEVGVEFINTQAVHVDTAFLITAFC